MRAFAHALGLLLALLVLSAGGERAPSLSREHGVSPFSSGERQAILSRSSGQTLALHAGGRQARRSHGPLPTTCIFPSRVGLTAPLSQAAEQRTLLAQPTLDLVRRAHAPRAPPLCSALG